MTETIIRWAVSVAFMVLAFIWGYGKGQVKGYTYYIAHSKHIADSLLGIIHNYEKNMKRISDAVDEVMGEQNERLEQHSDNRQGRCELGRKPY